MGNVSQSCVFVGSVAWWPLNDSNLLARRYDSNNFLENFEFFRENLSHFLTRSAIHTLMSITSLSVLLLFALSVSSLIHESSGSFLAPPSSTVSPSKVTLISWKPRSLVLSISNLLCLIINYNDIDLVSNGLSIWWFAEPSFTKVFSRIWNVIIWSLL